MNYRQRISGWARAVLTAGARRRYEDTLNALVETHLGNNRTRATRINDLSEHLGCRYLLIGGDLEIRGLRQPAACHEPLVRAALLHYLRSQMRPTLPKMYWEDELPLMDGLARNERWRACLENMDDAYHLAALFLRFSQTYWRDGDKYSTGDKALLRSEIDAGAFNAFTQWVSPGTTPDRSWGPGQWTPEPVLIASALFGAAWCNLAFTGSVVTVEEVETAMRLHRPPFQPGLVPAQVDAPALGLPDLTFA